MDRRTAFISAASVAGVVLAGATAVGANVGILDRADSSGLGELSASTQAVEPQIIDVRLDPPGPSPTNVGTNSAPAGDGRGLDQVTRQSFAIEDAGLVTVAATQEGLRIANVELSGGWTWVENETDDGSVSASFTSVDVTYVFDASIAMDGTIAASVSQPVTEFVASSAPTPTGDNDGSEDHDEQEYEDEDDDHEYEDDDHDEHEYEYEYEGHEDDD